MTDYWKGTLMPIWRRHGLSIASIIAVIAAAIITVRLVRQDSQVSQEDKMLIGNAPGVEVFTLPNASDIMVIPGSDRIVCYGHDRLGLVVTNSTFVPMKTIEVGEPCLGACYSRLMDAAIVRTVSGRILACDLSNRESKELIAVRFPSKGGIHSASTDGRYCYCADGCPDDLVLILDLAAPNVDPRVVRQERRVCGIVPFDSEHMLWLAASAEYSIVVIGEAPSRDDWKSIPGHSSFRLLSHDSSAHILVGLVDDERTVVFCQLTQAEGARVIRRVRESESVDVLAIIQQGRSYCVVPWIRPPLQGKISIRMIEGSGPEIDYCTAPYDYVKTVASLEDGRLALVTSRRLVYVLRLGTLR